jgi:hypothetical protein
VEEEGQADIILVSLEGEPHPVHIVDDAQSVIDQWEKPKKVLNINYIYEFLQQNKFIGEIKRWGGLRLTKSRSI